MPLCCAIVVTYNSAAHVAHCLESLQKMADCERIVVDNASTDGTIQRVQTVDRAARLVINPENRGFGAAANQGAKIAHGDLFIFLNPDVIAMPGSLEALKRVLSSEEVGAAGGRLVGLDSETQVGFAVRRFPTLGRMLAEVLLLNRLWPRNPWNRRYRCLDLDYDRQQEVEQPAGACLAVKREAWKSIGGFDEQFYPLWFEDVDLCRRLRAKGWKIVYCPDACFQHVGAHSVKQLPFKERQLYWYRNLLRYFAKHHSQVATMMLRAGMAVGMVLRMIGSLFGRVRGEPGLRQSLPVYLAVIRDCVLKGANR